LNSHVSKQDTTARCYCVHNISYANFYSSAGGTASGYVGGFVRPTSAPTCTHSIIRSAVPGIVRVYLYRTGAMYTILYNIVYYNTNFTVLCYINKL
jgi:hypothetical protein